MNLPRIKHVISVLLADGFEEIETFTTIDILRRLNLDVKTFSINGARQVTGAHGIIIKSDFPFKSTDIENSQVLVLPGGMPGAENLRQHTRLKRSICIAEERGAVLAAICAAPMVFGQCGILKGRRATCYPGFEKWLEGAIYTANRMEIDGNIITAKGPGVSVEFAFAIASRFVSEEEIQELRKGMFIA